jgi:hypothetical protein
MAARLTIQTFVTRKWALLTGSQKRNLIQFRWQMVEHDFDLTGIFGKYGTGRNEPPTGGIQGEGQSG